VYGVTLADNFQYQCQFVDTDKITVRSKGKCPNY